MPADSRASSGSSILIRPWNYDPSDPWAYVERRGQTDPGGTALGPVWNRPIFVSTPLRTDLPRGVGQPSALKTPQPAETGPRVEIVGYSVLGIPLSLYRFGRSGPLTLIFGGIHGNERNSADLARRLAEHLMAHPEAYAERRIVLLPVANPDGTVKDSRTNSRGVDLNRNFPAKNWAAGKEGPQFGGKSPLSEPESTALAKLVEEAAPARIIAIHAIFGGRECNNYDGPAETLATLMGTLNHYPVKKSIGYPTPGSFGTWAGVERQIPVITLELPQGLPGEACWKVQREALLGVIQAP
jgi:protein MpaA